MKNNFLDCSSIEFFPSEQMSEAPIWSRALLETEITLGFDMEFEDEICPKCSGAAFIFDGECCAKNATLYFEYLDASNLSLTVELLDQNKRVYKSLKISGRDNLSLEGLVRDCTSQIRIVCFRSENLKKKGEVRIYL